jgi:hypothetical protein
MEVTMTPMQIKAHPGGFKNARQYYLMNPQIKKLIRFKRLDIIKKKQKSEERLTLVAAHYLPKQVNSFTSIPLDVIRMIGTF